VFAGSDAVIQLWLFILAPLAGAAVAGLTYGLLFGRDREPVAGSGLHFSRPARPTANAGWDPNAQYQQQAWDQSQQWGQAQQQWQTPVEQQYPGWRWDAAAQQWVPDQQWQQPQPPQAPEAEDPRTQIRPPDGPA
jgi:aquaporin Z